MQTELVHSNAVVVAHQFNPTIFSQLWLVRNEIATEDDFETGESVFTPAFVQVRSPRFVLLVLPEQLQIAPLTAPEQHSELVAEKIGRIAERLPETPYAGLGLNFHWTIEPESGEFTHFARALFYRDNPLFQQFGGDDARYGGYLSKGLLGFRLKLDIKPTKNATPDGTVERLLFAFNFHADVEAENAAGSIQQLVGQWNKVSNHATEIVRALENWKWR